MNGKQSKSKPVTPRSTIAVIETEVHRDFWERARTLVLDERWGRYHTHVEGIKNGNQRRHQRCIVVKEFAEEYSHRIEDAVASHVDLSAQTSLADGLSPEENRTVKTAIRFARKFGKDSYKQPWLGFFLVTRGKAFDDIDRSAVAGDFQRVQTSWFGSGQEVTKCFYDGLRGWKGRARSKASNSFRLRMKLSPSGRVGQAPGRLARDFKGTPAPRTESHTQKSEKRQGDIEISRDVENILCGPRFKQAFNAMWQSKKQSSRLEDWESAIRQAGITSQFDIGALISSRKVESAAAKSVASKRSISYRSVQNAVSRSKKPR